MNAIADALKTAVDALISFNATEVSVGGQKYTASVNYASDMGLTDFSERQTSQVTLSYTDYASEPAEETEITETESGKIHRVKKVTFQGVCWVCECSFRHNTHNGPFK